MKERNVVKENLTDISAGGPFTDKERNIWIVTTACLPWKTGTSINPLLRALYLLKYYRSSKLCKHQPNVYLMVPWLVKSQDRKYLYGDEIELEDGASGMMQQANLIRDWARDFAKMSEEGKLLKISFYPSRYQEFLGSIFPCYDVCSLIPDEKADLAILEEPEHLNWIPMHMTNHSTERSSKSWSEKFHHVVGIVHTNYPAYARGQGTTGLLTSPTIHTLSSAIVRSYCHKVILLSDTLPSFGHPHEITCNVHGVRSEFLVEDRITPKTLDTCAPDIYFIGKLLWTGKGFDFLLECEEIFKEITGDYFPIDIYGAGPDEQYIKDMFGLNIVSSQIVSKQDTHGERLDGISDQIQKAMESILSHRSSLKTYLESDQFDVPLSVIHDTNYNDDIISSRSVVGDLSKTALDTVVRTSCATVSIMKSAFQKSANIRKPKGPIPARLLGTIDHAQISKQYKIFVNTSTTEVLCTTTAEALAMGDKWVIIPKHPSNQFFFQFSNCLIYSNLEEFVRLLRFSRLNQPRKIPFEQSQILSWEIATMRLISSMRVSDEQILSVDEKLRWIHQESRKLISNKMVGQFCSFLETDSIREYWKEY